MLYSSRQDKALIGVVRMSVQADDDKLSGEGTPLCVAQQRSSNFSIICISSCAHYFRVSHSIVYKRALRKGR